MWKYRVDTGGIPLVNINVMVTTAPGGRLIPTDDPAKAIGTIWTISKECEVTIVANDVGGIEHPWSRNAELKVPLSNIVGNRCEWVMRYENDSR